jgi:Arc/MetJ-type ribon-helix-helix transcriptional regulator
MKRFVNIPEDALVFIDRQVAAGKYRSRSHAITQAIYMLRDSSLYAGYLEAFSDIDPAWDTVISDGVIDSIEKLKDRVEPFDGDSLFRRGSDDRY